MPLSVALGGGGFYGIGWLLGVVDALDELGVDLRPVPRLGTSAGAWVAACLSCGVTVEDFLEIEPPPVPAPQRRVLHRFASNLFGARRDRLVTGSAVAIPLMRRRLLEGHRSDLADIVAASAAVPAVFAPHRIGRTDYVDGGVRSPVSADLAAPARHLLVAAPIGGRVLGPAGRATDAWAEREISRWRERWGGNVTFIRPGRQASAVVGATPRSLFDRDRAVRAYEAARIEVPRVMHGPLAADLDQLRHLSPGTSGTGLAGRPSELGAVAP